MISDGSKHVGRPSLWIDTLEMALAASGLDVPNVADRPRLLLDNGSIYVAGELAAWLSDHDMRHVFGAPYHPMT